MLSVDDYRKREQECLERAQNAAGPEDKVRWIELADAWHKLANGQHVILPPDLPVAPATSQRH